MTIAPGVEVEILNEANGVISNEQISDHSASDDEGNESEDDPLDRIKFPKSLLKRIVKEQMESSGAAGDDLSKVQISKNCLEAFDEAAKLFIHYVTWSAGEELGKTKRQTMGWEDVIKGLEEAEYGEFVAHLREYIGGLHAGKKKVGGGGDKKKDVDVITSTS